MCTEFTITPPSPSLSIVPLHPTRPDPASCATLVFLVHVNVGSELREAGSLSGDGIFHVATFGCLVVGVDHDFLSS